MIEDNELDHLHACVESAIEQWQDNGGDREDHMEIFEALGRVARRVLELGVCDD